MLCGMSDRRLAAILVAVAFLMRLQLYLGTAIFGTDSSNMLRMADAFSEGRFQDALAIGYHPLFPLLISMLKPLLGSERAGFSVSILLGSAAAAPLFLLARDVVGRPAAFVGVLLYAFHPHIVEVQADAMTEGTFMFFFFTAMWLGWEGVKSPRWDFAILAGLSSGAAYLTRPEGLLAVVAVPFWLLVSMGRGRWTLRALTAATSLVVALLVMYPYLLWSRTQTNRWTISAKGSVQAVESGKESPEVETRRPLHALGRHLLKVSYFVGLPLIALGLLAIRPRWATLFYFSFPVVYWLALAWASRRNPVMSYRYLLPGMALLLPLAGLGLVRWIRRPRRLAAAVAAIVVLLAARNLRPHRWEERPFRDAAAWIAAQKRGAIIASTTDKIAYLAGSPVARAFPKTWEEFSASVRELDYVVCTSGRAPKYRERIEERLGAPLRFRADGGGVEVFRCPSALP